MKKLTAFSFLALSASIFLTGCETIKWDTVKSKIPFLQTEKVEDNQGNKATEITENDKNATDDTQQDNTEEEYPWTLASEFFNDIKEVDGRNIIQNPTNTVSLVNKEFGLPDGYVPDDLIRPKVSFSFGDQDIEKSYLREEAGKALEEMFNAAQKDGVYLYAVSGYRSFTRQQDVFAAEINRVGEEKALEAVAYPGNSEHQTGLAMDISSESVGFLLEEGFTDTKEGKWLANNAHQYGFILRYPKGKEAITGYKFEPWHFRFVGKKSAKDIYENDWTLEEYFNKVRKI